MVKRLNEGWKMIRATEDIRKKSEEIEKTRKQISVLEKRLSVLIAEMEEMVEREKLMKRKVLLEPFNLCANLQVKIEGKSPLLHVGSRI